jgi:hypothetical protein
MKIAYNSNYEPCPAGPQNLVCVDVVDLGIVETQYGAKPKVRLTFASQTLKANGKPYYLNKHFTASLHEKSTLRKFIRGWKGKDLPEAELKDFDLERYIGESCTTLVTPSADGKFANFETVMACRVKFKGPADYVRKKDRPDYTPPPASIHPGVPDISVFDELKEEEVIN